MSRLSIQGPSVTEGGLGKEDLVSRRYFNGLKTAALFGVLWAVVLLLGSFIGSGRYIWLFAGLGLLGTAYSY